MKIEVLGTSFVIQSDQDPAYLRDIVDLLKAKITEIENTVSTNDPLKISILSSMLIADDYFKIKQGKNSPESMDALEASNIAQKMIKKLDAMLEPLDTSSN